MKRIEWREGRFRVLENHEYGWELEDFLTMCAAVAMMGVIYVVWSRLSWVRLFGPIPVWVFWWKESGWKLGLRLKEYRWLVRTYWLMFEHQDAYVLAVREGLPLRGMALLSRKHGVDYAMLQRSVSAGRQLL